jgi:hypothetical protein
MVTFKTGDIVFYTIGGQRFVVLDVDHQMHRIRIKNGWVDAGLFAPVFNQTMRLSRSLFDDETTEPINPPEPITPCLPKCTCGSYKTYGPNGTHSDWCDLFTEK